MSGTAGRSAEVLRAGGGIGVEVRTAGQRVAISHIYKSTWSLAQARGLPSNETALEMRFARGAVGTTSALTTTSEQHFDLSKIVLTELPGRPSKTNQGLDRLRQR